MFVDIAMLVESQVRPSALLVISSSLQLHQLHQRPVVNFIHYSLFTQTTSSSLFY